MPKVDFVEIVSVWIKEGNPLFLGTHLPTKSSEIPHQFVKVMKNSHLAFVNPWGFRPVKILKSTFYFYEKFSFSADFFITSIPIFSATHADSPSSPQWGVLKFAYSSPITKRALVIFSKLKIGTSRKYPIINCSISHVESFHWMNAWISAIECLVALIKDTRHVASLNLPERFSFSLFYFCFPGYPYGIRWRYCWCCG